jgi:hypothetical protein
MTVVSLRVAGWLALLVPSFVRLRRVRAAGCVASPAGAQDVPAPTAARPWRLVYAMEARGRRGLDVYVADVPGGTPRRVAGEPGYDDFLASSCRRRAAPRRRPAPP